ncbi:unnamed protein product [Microthlaspi erraticum]|uniref:Uncharacterized protein n=1 Tax=Microthlaspi erraticum TaxID=1685480 RepID=A0A6D2J1I5_9BRAS|nr:unnamed protein product [Microthlaspi erraticum]
MTNSEGSRASQRRMVEGESSNAVERRLKLQADLEGMNQRIEVSDAEGYVYSELESESERLREERRTKKRNDPISSESEQGDFEIGVNIGREESDESESEEEGEEVNQEVDESGHESNQDEPMEEAEPQEEEDELPMYQEHYNALFSMDFVETKYPHCYRSDPKPEVDRNLLRVSRPRATTDPAISGSEQSKRDSRLTRSNSACGLDSVELELDFVFTSSSDSKQLDLDKDTWWARGHFTGPEWTYLDLRT